MVGEQEPKTGPWGRQEPAAAPGSPAQRERSEATPPRSATPIAPLKATDFFAAQRTNRRNTWFLIFVLLCLGGAFGYLLGLVVDAANSDPATFDVFTLRPMGVAGAAVLVGIGVVASLVAIVAGERVMIGLTGAHEVSREDEPLLHNVVEEMAIASGLPKPRVVLIETDAVNAFATGMKPERAALGVTRGLLGALTRDELQGVVGHEMTHIANFDTRYMTAVGILVGLIALVADGVRRSIYYGGGRRRGKGAGLLIVVLFLVSILAPIAAKFVQYAVSRQREYLADATAVRLTRNPRGLIMALRKLASAAQPFEGANRATQHMFIVNPFRNFDETASALVATHPPIRQRIERLQNLGAD